MMEDNIWFEWIVGAALLVYPLWRIFLRTGLNPALSLFIFLPGIGLLVVALILAFSHWPKIDGGGLPQ
jgi:hypothetical protein